MTQFHRLEELRLLKRLVAHLGTSAADARTTETTRARSDHDPAPGWALLDLPAYVLITPARNEAQFIESTIKSVLGQTVRPLKWVIVSDGSTDGTDDIVKRYSRDHHWIELMRMPERGKRNFSGKACAVNAAYASVRNLEFQVIVSLDGDISLNGDHFAYLLSQLAQNPALGVVGTPFQEVSGETYDYRFVSIEHVSGACQVFRRQCFEAINGYMPIAGGGIDQAAVINARMRGWKTMTFTGMRCLHHRKMGTADHGEYAAWFRTGMKDYRLGGHPLWELGRVFYRISKKPVIVGSLMLGAGYCWALVRRVERPLPHELEAFHREEQMRRLKKFFTRKRMPDVEKLQRPA